MITPEIQGMSSDKLKALSAALSVRFFNGTLAPWPSSVLIRGNEIVVSRKRMGYALFFVSFSVILFCLCLLFLFLSKNVMIFIFLFYFLFSIAALPFWNKYFRAEIALVKNDTLNCSGFSIRVLDIDEFYSIESRGGVMNLEQDSAGFSSGSIDDVWNAHVIKLSSGQFIVLHKGFAGFHSIESTVASFLGKNVIRIYFPNGLALNKEDIELLVRVRNHSLQPK